MIKIVGDINLADGFFDIGFGIGSSIVNGENPFRHIIRNTEDIWLGNFEFVCSNFTNKKGAFDKQFRISPKYLKGLHHLNYYNIANNHVMQHGENAYYEMLNNIVSFDSKYVGSNDKRTVSFEHQGKSIGILAFSQRQEKYEKNALYWYSPEYSEIIKEYESISSNNYKIVYLHWGNEFINRPYLDQKKLAHWLIELGFDLVIGVHPHVLQGYEKYKNKQIFYSLGNFVFNMPWEPTKYSIILNVDLSTAIPEINYNYIHIGKDYSPKIIEEIHVPEKYRFEHLNELLLIEEENELYYSAVFSNLLKYRKSNFYSIFSNLYKYKITDLISLLRDFISRRILK